MNNGLGRTEWDMQKRGNGYESLVFREEMSCEVSQMSKHQNLGIRWPHADITQDHEAFKHSIL